MSVQLPVLMEYVVDRILHLYVTKDSFKKSSVKDSVSKLSEMLKMSESSFVEKLVNEKEICVATNQTKSDAEKLEVFLKDINVSVVKRSFEIISFDFLIDKNNTDASDANNPEESNDTSSDKPVQCPSCLKKKQNLHKICTKCKPDLTDFGLALKYSCAPFLGSIIGISACSIYFVVCISTKTSIDKKNVATIFDTVTILSTMVSILFFILEDKKLLSKYNIGISSLWSLLGPVYFLKRASVIGKGYWIFILSVTCLVLYLIINVLIASTITAYM